MVSDLQAHLPTLRWVFSRVWLKTVLTPMPHPPYSPNLAPSNLFFLLFVSPDEKSPQREIFCWSEKGETKSGRSTKRHQNWQVQKLFWAVGKNISTGVFHRMESTLKVTEVSTWKNTQIFINKLWVLCGPPRIITRNEKSDLICKNSLYTKLKEHIYPCAM